MGILIRINCSIFNKEIELKYAKKTQVLNKKPVEMATVSFSSFESNDILNKMSVFLPIRQFQQSIKCQWRAAFLLITNSLCDSTDENNNTLIFFHSNVQSSTKSFDKMANLLKFHVHLALVICVLQKFSFEIKIQTTNFALFFALLNHIWLLVWPMLISWHSQHKQLKTRFKFNVENIHKLNECN